MDKFNAEEMRNRLRHVKKYCAENNSDTKRNGCKNCPALDEIENYVFDEALKLMEWEATK